MATFMAGKQLYQDFAAGPTECVVAPPVSVCIGLSVVATMAAQLVAYPMYTIKSCLQSEYPYKGANAWQCTRAILNERGGVLGESVATSCVATRCLHPYEYFNAVGLTGLYRGVAINAAKATPAVAVTYTVYEQTKAFLNIV